MAALLKDAQRLVDEHTAWREERGKISAKEERGEYVGSDDWYESDQAGVNLADEMADLLTRLLGLTEEGSE